MSSKILGYFNDLELNYTDKLGRITYLPANNSDYTKGKYDSLNQHLWTGETLLLFSLFFNLNDEFKLHWYITLKGIKKVTEIAPGLYKRHPDPYSDKDPRYDEISLDEYLGINFSYKVVDLNKESQDILDYHKKKNWCVSDKSSLVDLNIKQEIFTIKFLKTAYQVIKYCIVSGDFTGSNDLDKIIETNPGVDLLTSYRQPKDQLFIYLSANKRAPILCWLHFFVTALLTLKGSNNEKSGRILLFFKLLYLQKFFKPIKWLAKYYDKKMTYKYGIFPLAACFKLYYEHKEHPFHRIAECIYIDDNGLIRTLVK